MFSIGRYWSAFMVVLLLFLVVGCSEDSDMGIVEPLADEPIIVDAATCLRIEDTRPAGITDTFLESDDKIYIWIYWSNVDAVSTVEVLWFEPDEDTALLSDSQTIDSSSGFAITWFSIDKPLGDFAEGDWSVDVYLDGLFERSYLFTVVD